MRNKYMYMFFVCVFFITLGLKLALSQVEKNSIKKEVVNMDALRKQIVGLVQKGQKEAAIKLGEEYLKKDPGNIEILVNMAECYATDNLTQSEVMAKKAVSIDPKNNWAVKTLAKVYRIEGEKAQTPAEKEKLFVLAMAEIVKVLAMEPDNAFNNVEAALIFFRNGKKDEAMKFLKKAIAAQPNDSYIAEIRKIIEK